MLTRQAEILLVEDNQTDCFLITEAFNQLGTKNNVHIAKDGFEALLFIKKQGEYENVVTPDLILLDLKMPRVDGLEVLKEIKKDVKLQAIPIIVLTVSKDDKDLKDAYDLYANAYIIKPVDIEDYTKLARSIENFWLKNVRLPYIEA